MARGNGAACLSSLPQITYLSGMASQQTHLPGRKSLPEVHPYSFRKYLLFPNSG